MIGVLGVSFEDLDPNFKCAIMGFGEVAVDNVLLVSHVFYIPSTLCSLLLLE